MTSGRVRDKYCLLAIRFATENLIFYLFCYLPDTHCKNTRILKMDYFIKEFKIKLEKNIKYNII